jgi:hypothetical protein
MSGTAPSDRLEPPFVHAPITTDNSSYTQPWLEYHQEVADRVSALAKIHQGVTDGSDAKAGDVGEYLSGTGGPVTLTNAAVTNIASVNLTAGDWDVSGNVAFTAGSGTHTFFGAGIGGLDTFSSATFPSAALNMGIATATRRYNVTAATTVWVVAEAGFGGGSMTATGTVRARRMR